jgi:hypothetical protein
MTGSSTDLERGVAGRGPTVRVTRWQKVVGAIGLVVVLAVGVRTFGGGGPGAHGPPGGTPAGEQAPSPGVPGDHAPPPGMPGDHAPPPWVPDHGSGR